MTSLSKMARAAAVTIAIAATASLTFAIPAVAFAQDHAAAPAHGASGTPGDQKDGEGKGNGDGSGKGHGDGTGSGTDHAKGEGPGHAATAHGEHAAAGEHGEHGADGEHGAPGPINWADFSNTKQPPYAALVVNFLILVGMYVYFGKKPVADGLKKRRADIAKEIEEAQRIKHEAEERAKMYQAKLATLETELAEARQALVEAGKGERDRIIREAEERASRMARDAQLLLDQELKQMRDDLVRETVHVAVAAAEEMLRSSVTHADQERLAEDFLRDMTAKGSTAAAASVTGGGAS